MAGVALFKRPRPAAPSPAAAPEKGPPTDPLVGDATAHRFRAELAAGRWREFHDFLEATRDWNSRDFYVSKLSALDERPAWLEEWAAVRPGSSLPWLFRGHQGVHWAWQARGGGRAHTVGEDAWPVFYARLVEADRDLARAAGLDDEDPTPHAEGIRVAIGLQLGPAEKQKRFGEAIRRSRWHRNAHTMTVQATAAKWGGSEKEMFEFARWASSQAPEGSDVHVAVPLAHLEQWLGLPSKSADGQPVQSRYFRDGQVGAEIWQAADRSVRSPRYQPSRYTPSDRNIFAMCFCLMRDYQAQLDQMRLIGPLVTASPWNYQGDPGWAYERARTRAAAAIGIPQPAAQGPGPYRTP
jgi:hypothetical protein